MQTVACERYLSLSLSLPQYFAWSIRPLQLFSSMMQLIQINNMKLMRSLFCYGCSSFHPPPCLFCCPTLPPIRERFHLHYTIFCGGDFRCASSFMFLIFVSVRFPFIWQCSEHKSTCYMCAGVIGLKITRAQVNSIRNELKCMWRSAGDGAGPTAVGLLRVCISQAV